MENMLHLRYTTSQAAALPSKYVLADQVPAASAAGRVSLPLIDMSRSHDEVRQAILDAGKEFGFFMVVNHGVPDEVMKDMIDVCEEFFRLPAEDKAHLYSEERHKPNRMFSSSTYETGGEKYWRDCLHLTLSDGTKDWPQKPLGIREKIEKFGLLTRGLGMELLRMLCEAMGVPPDYLMGDISGYFDMSINHYPPCPNPSKTLGLPPHCDRNLITLLHPGKVYGLEVAYKGEWVKVEPVPHAFVVNFGQQLEVTTNHLLRSGCLSVGWPENWELIGSELKLQVVTNGLLKSIEHRAVTNSVVSRTSVAAFIEPTSDCLVGPAEEFISEVNPPFYRTVKYGDFLSIYNVVNLASSINLTTNLKNVQKDI
ncbi:hypothetical protein EJB05_35236 [Eragrostis curvula]|uniref:Fe2OG dioxygenase domain-containing protein n=1 Tax=Eragrostis curvula TaxID=38414 RepID=A0A5J9U630_9POAL|nr:hypothetical protein EJB05_35236 [Eragrostis curvula]